MKIKKLVIGSSNPAKVNEWKFLLKDDVELISAVERGVTKSPKEEGKTFLENAIQKAKYYSKQTRGYVLSEDGGFEVDCLNGLPGIKSRRILPGDKDGTDEEIINFILKKLEGISEKKKNARLSSKVVISDPEGNIIYEDEGSIEGIIPKKASKKLIKGYPYRSILYLPEINKYYSELTEEEHKKMAHKKSIAERISKFLIKYK